MPQKPFDLIVTDIDNTVFDWVSYYVNAFIDMLQFVETKIGARWQKLAEESKVVFGREGSIEYPFLLQELPAVNRYYGSDIDRMLQDLVAPARDVFLKTAEGYFKPYDGVRSTLLDIRDRFSGLPIVALTDAPRYVAMWKLNKLSLLSCFDAVYGLNDPRIPVCEVNRRVKVDSDILIKHLQRAQFSFTGKVRILPDEYEKPGLRGLKTVLMDYDLDEASELRSRVLWIGDNLRKDVGLGNALGVTTCWAEYGTWIDTTLIQKLALFSPTQNVHKNVYLSAADPKSPVPSNIFKRFEDLKLLFS